MIGILIIAHGTLGESLIHCASHVLNKRPPRVQQLGVTGQDDPHALLPQARALLKELDDGDGILILSDMYGGTPANIAAKLIVPGHIEGVAGVNLPMLIRSLTYRDRPLSMLVTKAVSGGCEGVVRIAALKLHDAATRS
jgi:PTS system ascorbate-specific IIA component